MQFNLFYLIQCGRDIRFMEHTFLSARVLQSFVLGPSIRYFNLLVKVTTLIILRVFLYIFLLHSLLYVVIIIINVLSYVI